MGKTLQFCHKPIHNKSDEWTLSPINQFNRFVKAFGFFSLPHQITWKRVKNRITASVVAQRIFTQFNDNILSLSSIFTQISVLIRLIPHINETHQHTGWLAGREIAQPLRCDRFNLHLGAIYFRMIRWDDSREEQNKQRLNLLLIYNLLAIIFDTAANCLDFVNGIAFSQSNANKLTMWP